MVVIVTAVTISPGTSAGTSPARPAGGPDTPGYQNRTAPSQTGGALISHPPLGASAAAGRREDRGRRSHRRTRRSGRGGTESGRGRQQSPLPLCSQTALGERRYKHECLSHFFGEEVISHYYLVVYNDSGVSRHHRIHPGDHRNTKTSVSTNHSCRTFSSDTM